MKKFIALLAIGAMLTMGAPMSLAADAGAGAGAGGSGAGAGAGVSAGAIAVEDAPVLVTTVPADEVATTLSYQTIVTFVFAGVVGAAALAFSGGSSATTHHHSQ